MIFCLPSIIDQFIAIVVGLCAVQYHIDPNGEPTCPDPTFGDISEWPEPSEAINKTIEFEKIAERVSIDL